MSMIVNEQVVRWRYSWEERAFAEGYAEGFERGFIKGYSKALVKRFGEDWAMRYPEFSNEMLGAMEEERVIAMAQEGLQLSIIGEVTGFTEEDINKLVADKGLNVVA